MLSRRDIRIKVMESIYAFRGSASDDLSKTQKFLLFNVQQVHTLYLLIMALMIQIQKRALSNLEKQQQKHLATPEDKNPNRRFVDNQLLALLIANTGLQKTLEDKKITHWEQDAEYVDLLFKALTESDLYKAYMQSENSGFKQDKALVVAIFKTIIAPNEKLHAYIEDKHLSWLGDLPTINTYILKQLRKTQADTPESHFLPEVYKNSDDKAFAIDLLKKTILNATTLSEEITRKTQNWDINRIAYIDYVLLQMAIAELKYFPSIPVKVTINEYLEIAKEYSTPKSSIFINGILDKLASEYKASGTLNKVGRGLL